MSFGNNKLKSKANNFEINHMRSAYLTDSRQDLALVELLSSIADRLLPRTSGYQVVTYMYIGNSKPKSKANNFKINHMHLRYPTDSWQDLAVVGLFPTIVDMLLPSASGYQVVTYMYSGNNKPKSKANNFKIDHMRLAYPSDSQQDLAFVGLFPTIVDRLIPSAGG